MIPMSAASWEEELRRTLLERWDLSPTDLTTTIDHLQSLSSTLVQTAAAFTILNDTCARAQNVPKSQYSAITLEIVTPALAIEGLTLGLDLILLPEASAYVRALALEALTK